MATTVEVDGGAVADVLAASAEGFMVSWEYPGILMMHRDGVTISTGLHGWEYGTVESDSPYLGTDLGVVSLDEDRWDLSTVEGVRAAWHDVLVAWDAAGDVSAVLDPQGPMYGDEE